MFLTHTETPAIVIDSFVKTSFIILVYLLAIIFRVPHMVLMVDYKKENKFIKEINKKLNKKISVALKSVKSKIKKL